MTIVKGDLKFAKNSIQNRFEQEFNDKTSQV